MVLRDDENKRQVDRSRDSCGSERYHCAAMSPVPNGKDIPAVDIRTWQLGVGLAENV
jgi:hypothetical protein